MTTSETYEGTEQLAQREFRITSMQPGTSIEANFEVIEAKIAEIVDMYSGVVVSLDYLPDAKKDRAWLNGLVKSVEQRRIEAKNAYLAPYNAFEAQVKHLLAPVREASANLDRQIKELEEQEKLRKRQLLLEHYEEYAGILADAVPFERIEDPKWLNKTVDLMSAYSAIERIVEKIIDDETTLDSLSLAHPTEAKAEFFATLDLARAIARSKEIDEQIERTRRFDEEKAANRASLEAAPPEPVPEPLPEPTPALEAPATWHLEVTCTRAQLDTLIAYLREQGITGRAVK